MATDVALLNAVLALAPASVLLLGAAVAFSRERAIASFLQVFGAVCLVLVVLTHICEALRLFPVMRWGEEASAGHYLDLASAVLGLTLFPLGYLLHQVKRPVGRTTA
jgi:hypothetical protein